MNRSRSLSFPVLGLTVLALSLLPAAQAPSVRQDEPLDFDGCTSVLVGTAGLGRRLDDDVAFLRRQHGPDLDDHRPQQEAQARGHGHGLVRAQAEQGAQRFGPDRDGRDPAGRGDLHLPERRLPDHERAPVGDRGNDNRRQAGIAQRGRHHRRAGTLPPGSGTRQDGPRGDSGRRSADRQFGYNDWGECFTFVDPQEVWHFEIHGPGKARQARSGPLSASPTTRSASPPMPGASARSTSPNRLLHGVGERHVARRRHGLWSKTERQALRVQLRLRPDRHESRTAAAASGAS